MLMFIKEVILDIYTIGKSIILCKLVQTFKTYDHTSSHNNPNNPSGVSVKLNEYLKFQYQGQGRIQNIETAGVRDLGLHPLKPLYN